jgi:hypothetical protein
VVSRRKAIVTGLVCVTVYATSALLSGHLSPLAKGPLLDGIGPPQPYRWVNPPPDLAATNQPPSSGVFHVPLKVGGSAQTAFVTSDNQVTVIVPEGAFAARPGQIEVILKVDPIDPATLSSPGKGLTVFGNAYRFAATYQPSGDRATLESPLDVIMLYPSTASLHASAHQLYVSPGGKEWTAQEGSDSLAAQQAEGALDALRPASDTAAPEPFVSQLRQSIPIQRLLDGRGQFSRQRQILQVDARFYDDLLRVTLRAQSAPRPNFGGFRCTVLGPRRDP